MYIVDLIDRHYNDFNSEDLSRVIGFGTQIRYITPKLMGVLVDAAYEQSSTITVREMSFILWGFAKARHPLPRSVFSDLALEITENLEVNVWMRQQTHNRVFLS